MTTNFISPQDPTSYLNVASERWQATCCSVTIQPLIDVKEDQVDCQCSYWTDAYATCSPGYYHYNPNLPGDALGEFWIKRGYITQTPEFLEEFK